MMKILEKDILIMILTAIPKDKVCYELDKQLEKILVNYPIASYGASTNSINFN